MTRPNSEHVPSARMCTILNVNKYDIKVSLRCGQYKHTLTWGKIEFLEKLTLVLI